MKRTLPFPLYGYANTDGTGRGNWSQAHLSEEPVYPTNFGQQVAGNYGLPADLAARARKIEGHPSETTVGRIRKDGGIDRRYRMAVRQAYVWPEPRPVTRWEQVREVVAILLSMAVLVVWGLALFWAIPILLTAWAS